MIYYCVLLKVDDKQGFVSKSSKELLNGWGDAVFCTDYNIAEKIAQRACDTTRKLYPRSDISFYIIADHVTPSGATILNTID